MPDQKVVVKVDALGGRKFHGEVTQIGGATGSRLSLFPPENATGNYVKVVQRIPVRIDFTNLRAGEQRSRAAAWVLGHSGRLGQVVRVRLTRLPSMAAHSVGGYFVLL